VRALDVTGLEGWGAVIWMVLVLNNFPSVET
jgi:hypothetical protein